MPLASRTLPTGLRRFVVLALLYWLSACETNAQPTSRIELLLPGAAQARQMLVSTTLAEYLELTDRGNFLSLTLSNYKTTCDEFIPPTGEQMSISVLVATPLGVAPTAGIYPFRAAVSARTAIDKAQSVPTIRVPGKSVLFKPGGGIQLNQVALSEHGSVAGLLAFQFAGDGSHPATSITGPFSAKICRLDQLQKPND